MDKTFSDALAFFDPLSDTQRMPQTMEPSDIQGCLRDMGTLDIRAARVFTEHIDVTRPNDVYPTVKIGRKIVAFLVE